MFDGSITGIILVFILIDLSCVTFIQPSEFKKVEIDGSFHVNLRKF